jgi:hypothetical protein
MTNHRSVLRRAERPKLTCRVQERPKDHLTANSPSGGSRRVLRSHRRVCKRVPREMRRPLDDVPSTKSWPLFRRKSVPEFRCPTEIVSAASRLATSRGSLPDGASAASP